MPYQECEPRFVSLDQAATLTQLSTRTLRRAIKARRLQAHRVGRRVRIEVTELERWVRENGDAAEAAPLATANGAAR